MMLVKLGLAEGPSPDTILAYDQVNNPYNPPTLALTLALALALHHPRPSPSPLTPS